VSEYDRTIQYEHRRLVGDFDERLAVHVGEGPQVVLQGIVNDRFATDVDVHLDLLENECLRVCGLP
jgi:hypothetical protein